MNAFLWFLIVVGAFILVKRYWPKYQAFRTAQRYARAGWRKIGTGGTITLGDGTTRTIDGDVYFRPLKGHTK